MSKKETLISLISGVRNFFGRCKVSVPFYIAGGSIFSTLNGHSEYNDIDVFFYSEADFHHARDRVKSYIFHETENASTIHGISANGEPVPFGSLGDDIKLQLIRFSFGPPEEVFNRFDFNSSCVAFTSDLKFIRSEDFDVQIKMRETQLSSQSLIRYNKYIRKGAKDSDEKTLKEIYTHMVQNIDSVLPVLYHGQDHTAFQMIRVDLEMNKNTRDSIFHDTVVQNLDEDDRIDVFTKFSNPLLLKPKNNCDQLRLAKILFVQQHRDKILKNAGSGATQRLIQHEKDMKAMYPEYFI